MKKRRDECLFCSKRKCHTRIVREKAPRYDEVACDKHIIDLEKHSDDVLGKGNGVMRWHLSNSDKVKRGDSVPSSNDDRFNFFS